MIKDILELAREAGLLSEDEAWVSLHQEAMERFAALLEAKIRADDRKLLEQALEALELHAKQYPHMQKGYTVDAITAVRERLAKPDPRNQCGETCERAKLCAVCLAEMGAQPDPLQRLTDVQQEIEAALAPEQKPVDIGTEWTSCVKLPVTVHVRQQRPGETHVSTREGITPVKPDDLIMRGVSGEEYPIGREIFERTYHLGEAHTKPEHTPQQEVQKPVAWLYSEGLTALKAGKCWTAYGTQQDKDNSIPLYTASQQRQPLTDEEKLIDLLEAARETFKKSPSGSECSQNAAYVHSVLETMLIKREWQGLTDEEYNRLVMEHLGPHALTGGKMSVYDAFLLAIRATEAKLKEKNT